MAVLPRSKSLVVLSIEEIRATLPEHMEDFAEHLLKLGKKSTTVAQYVSMIKTMVKHIDPRDSNQFNEFVLRYSPHSRGTRYSARTAYVQYAGSLDSPVERLAHEDEDSEQTPEGATRAMRVSNYARKYIRQYVEFYAQGAYEKNIHQLVQDVLGKMKPVKQLENEHETEVRAYSNKELAKVPPKSDEIADLLDQLQSFVFDPDDEIELEPNEEESTLGAELE